LFEEHLDQFVQSDIFWQTVGSQTPLVKIVPQPVQSVLGYFKATFGKQRMFKFFQLEIFVKIRRRRNCLISFENKVKILSSKFCVKNF
jgi:hypothetical protein